MSLAYTEQMEVQGLGLGSLTAEDWGFNPWSGNLDSTGKPHSLAKKKKIEWITKVLLYSIGNYIQYPGINHNGKEYEKEYIYIYLSHFAVLQKLTQHCKSMILLLKKKRTLQFLCKAVCRAEALRSSRSVQIAVDEKHFLD